MDPNTFPTKGNLILAKNSLVLAKQGYELMDKKRNILIRELMELIDKAKDIQSEIDITFTTAYKALQARDNLANKYSKEPTISQIAEELNIPREEIVFALDAIQDPISLFEPIYNDGGDPIFVMDQISDDRNTDGSWVEGVSIKEGMSKLGERERMILTMRFYEGRTQMEVADEIGISQAQVSRLEKAALRHLRKYMATS